MSQDSFEAVEKIVHELDEILKNKSIIKKMHNEFQKLPNDLASYGVEVSKEQVAPETLAMLLIFLRFNEMFKQHAHDKAGTTSIAAWFSNLQREYVEFFQTCFENKTFEALDQLEQLLSEQPDLTPQIKQYVDNMKNEKLSYVLSALKEIYEKGNYNNETEVSKIINDLVKSLDPKTASTVKKLQSEAQKKVTASNPGRQFYERLATKVNKEKQTNRETSENTPPETGPKKP